MDDQHPPYAMRYEGYNRHVVMKRYDDGHYHDIGEFKSQFDASQVVRLLCEDKARSAVLVCTLEPPT